MKKIEMKEKGITLIALVITIIVLLILAGVTIATLTGDNGILTKATEAKDKTEEASAEEQVQLAVTWSIGTDGNINIDDLNDNLGNIEGLTHDGESITNKPIEILPTVVKIDGNEVAITGNGEMLNVATIDEIKNMVYVEGTTLLKDVNNNNIILPKGFTIRIDDSTTNADSIDEGIVIEDQEQNQYVWIPVDGILGENGKTVSNAVDGEIILGRYVFDSNGNIDTENAVIPETLGGDLKKNSTESHSYTETSTGNGNTVAIDIDGFIDSVRNNGGYYIARFEASQNTTTNKAESKYDKTVWTDITQPNAANACQDLYAGVNSDLMNSYAWDTAILFIQKNGQSNYSKQDGNSINSSKQTTGLSGDKQLNIYDMAENCYEWSTETSSLFGFPCVRRGGTYSTSDYYTSGRYGADTTSEYPDGAFRSILYL